MAVIREKYPPAKAAIPEKNIEQDASGKGDTRLLVYTDKQGKENVESRTSAYNLQGKENNV